MTVKEKYHECQLSIVVPCYNEYEVIPELYRRITKVCKDLEIKYELILVNDGSTDIQGLGLVFLIDQFRKTLAKKFQRSI